MKCKARRPGKHRNQHHAHPFLLLRSALSFRRLRILCSPFLTEESALTERRLHRAAARRCTGPSCPRYSRARPSARWPGSEPSPGPLCPHTCPRFGCVHVQDRRYPRATPSKSALPWAISRPFAFRPPARRRRRSRLTALPSARPSARWPGPGISALSKGRACHPWMGLLDGPPAEPAEDGPPA